MFTLFILAIGAAMDALAVAIVQGVHTRTLRFRHAVLIAGTFGLAQAIMPLIGWLIGASLSDLISKVDHWIVFVLLAFLGGKMIWEAISNEQDKEAEQHPTINVKQLILLAIATSIDALALGITFALLQTNIWMAAGVIGVVTFVLALGGVYVGHKFGERFRRPAEIIGGIVLILIGTMILIEHLAT